MAAMASLIALLSLSAAVGTQASTINVGGASSVSSYVSGLILNLRNTPLYGSYASVGSSAGIKGFVSGAYQVAFSDNPLDNAQNLAAGGTAKLTIPFTIATYSFATTKTSGLQLTGAQIYSIYTSKTPIPWSKLKKGLTGNVIPVARSDGSGTTEVIGRWIRSKVSKFPLAATTQVTWKGIAGISPLVRYYKGTEGIGSFLKSAAGKNGLGYIQTGAAVKTYGLRAASIFNPSKKYVNAVSGADLQASVPRPEPKLDQSWNGINLLNKPGPQTYPIVSFGYSFAKKVYRTGAIGKAVKAFLLYTQSSGGQNLAYSYLFDAVPADYRKTAITYINKIK